MLIIEERNSGQIVQGLYSLKIVSVYKLWKLNVFKRRMRIYLPYEVDIKENNVFIHYPLFVNNEIIYKIKQKLKKHYNLI